MSQLSTQPPESGEKKTLAQSCWTWRLEESTSGNKSTRCSHHMLYIADCIATAQFGSSEPPLSQTSRLIVSHSDTSCCHRVSWALPRKKPAYVNEEPLKEVNFYGVAKTNSWFKWPKGQRDCKYLPHSKSVRLQWRLRVWVLWVKYSWREYSACDCRTVCSRLSWTAANATVCARRSEDRTMSNDILDLLGIHWMNLSKNEFTYTSAIKSRSFLDHRAIKWSSLVPAKSQSIVITSICQT